MICQHMPRYAILPLFGVCRPGRLTSWKKPVFSGSCHDMPRYAKICQETKGKWDNDKNIIHLPRHYTNFFEKALIYGQKSNFWKKFTTCLPLLKGSFLGLKMYWNEVYFSVRLQKWIFLKTGNGNYWGSIWISSENLDSVGNISTVINDYHLFTTCETMILVNVKSCASP